MTYTAWSNIAYSDLQPSPDATYIGRIGDAFKLFASDPYARNLLNQINQDLYWRSVDVVVSTRVDPQNHPGPWTAPLQRAALGLNANDFVISMMGSRADQNPFNTMKVDGFEGDFYVGAERMLLHELMHVYTTGLDAGQPKFASSSGYDYGEEISVFAENLMYRYFAFNNGLSDTQLRVGHLDGTPLVGTGGVTGVGAFDLVYDKSSIQLSKTADHVSFHAVGWNPEDTLTKSFYVPGTVVLDQSYDHYNLYELKPNDSMYARQSDGSLTYNISFYRPNETFFSKGVLGEVMAFDPLTAMQSAADAAFDLTELVKTNHSTIAQSYVDQFWRWFHESPKSFVGLGADRWVDGDGTATWDPTGVTGLDMMSISGPVIAGDDEYPSIIAIDRSETALDTLMLGSAGYENDYVDHTSSLDHMRGGSGNDVMIAGVSDAADYNVLNGMNGNDLLVGRSSWDKLIGGMGKDVLISGGGEDYLDGGSGIDLISFQDQTFGVDIRLDLGYSHTVDSTSAFGDYAKQNLHNVEGAIGTEADDTIHGRGHTILFGLSGDDTFHLKDGDVAVGGSGADRFYIDVDPNKQTNISLIDLDQDDQIFINGQLYTQGLVFDVERQQFFSSQFTSLAPQIDNQMARLDVSFGTNAPFLHVYMEGYSSGEAGIVQPARFESINFDNYAALFAPHDLIF